MFTKRQLRILELIIRNSYGITGTRIGEVVNVSSRTVRSEIVVINKILNKNGYQIHSSTKNGYFIDNEYYKQLVEFIRPYLSVTIEDENRIYKLLGLILFNGKHSFYLLSTEFNLVEQTLYKECKKIVKDLKKKYKFHKIILTSTSIECTGSEIEIRRLIFKIIKELITTNQADYYHKLSLLLYDNFYDDEYELLFQKIKFHLMIQDIVPDDKSLELICLATYALIIRNRCGYHIKTNTKSRHYPLMNELLNELVRLKYEIHDNDYALLIDYYWGIKLIDNENFSSVCEKVLYDFTQQIYLEYGLKLYESKDIIWQLKVHIEYMLRRLQTDYEIYNPLLYDIKKMFPTSYEKSLVMVDVILNNMNMYLSDHEVGYIALYVENYFSTVVKKLKTVLIKDSQNAHVEMIINWLRDNFENRIELIGTIELHRLDDFLKYHQIDLLITSRRIIHEIAVPHYVIEGIPYKRDFDLLNSLIHRLKDNIEFEMLVRRLFDSDLIQYYENRISYDDAIKDMSLKLEEKGFIEDSQIFYKATSEREKRYSTVINRSIAIPHPLKRIARESAIAVAILKHPVTIQGSQIKILFILALQEKEKENIYPLLGFFRRMAINRDITNHLLNIREPEEFLKHIYYLSKNIQ